MLFIPSYQSFPYDSYLQFSNDSDMVFLDHFVGFLLLGLPHFYITKTHAGFMWINSAFIRSHLSVINLPAIVTTEEFH